MKILVSPSKTQSLLRHPVPCAQSLLHPDKTLRIIRSLQHHRKERLGELLDVHGLLLDDTYFMIQNWTLAGSLPAIDLYTGVTFDGLHHLERTGPVWEYVTQHVRIFSALYGVLAPSMCVSPYRLDFTVRLWTRESLTTFWKKTVQSYFANEDWILDCASVEFSKLLDGISVPVHKVDFYDVDKNGKHKIISYNAKRMRGLLVAWCATRQLHLPTELREFAAEGYTYDTLSSTPSYTRFVRGTPQ